jgi:hypothetical protein
MYLMEVYCCYAFPCLDSAPIFTRRQYCHNYYIKLFACAVVRAELDKPCDWFNITRLKSALQQSMTFCLKTLIRKKQYNGFAMIHPYSVACSAQRESNREDRQIVDESLIRGSRCVSEGGNVEADAAELGRKNGLRDGWMRLAKYFLHGFGFFLLLLVLFYAWAFVSSSLAQYFQLTRGLLGFVGALLGLIVLLVALSLVLGGVNSLLTARFWFPVTRSFWDVMLQGIALLLPLYVLGIALLYLLEFALGDVQGVLIGFIPLSLVIGFVCKKVAETWRRDTPQKTSKD